MCSVSSWELWELVSKYSLLQPWTSVIVFTNSVLPPSDLTHTISSGPLTQEELYNNSWKAQPRKTRQLP